MFKVSLLVNTLLYNAVMRFINKNYTVTPHWKHLSIISSKHSHYTKYKTYGKGNSFNKDEDVLLKCDNNYIFYRIL